MSLSPLKQEILETMLLQEKPLKVTELVEQTKKEFKQVNMNVVGLIKSGFVCAPEKGLYCITEKGKQALGIPETTKEQAAAILAYAPHDKAFEFYEEVGKPLHLHAHSLRDFSNKLERADKVSIEFHTKRGDFEAWFKCLGDEELAKKIALLNHRKVGGEDLRKQLHSIVEQRYLELAKLSGEPLPTE
jgi:predicted transcriptional regulator